MDDEEEQQEATEVALERAIHDFLVAHTFDVGDQDKSMMLEGYVFHAVGRSFRNMNDHASTHVWSFMRNQPIDRTVGLARALNLTVERWYLDEAAED